MGRLYDRAGWLCRRGRTSRTQKPITRALAALLLLSGAVTVVGIVAISGSGTPNRPVVVQYGPHDLQLVAGGATVAPKVQNFGIVTLGQTSSPVTFKLTNNSDIPTRVGPVAVQGLNPGDFPISADACKGQSLTPLGGTCTVNASFGPTAVGPRAAQLNFVDGAGLPLDSASLSGTGTPPPTTTTTTRPVIATTTVARPSTTTTIGRPTSTIAIATTTTVALTTTTSTVAVTTTLPEATTVPPIPLPPGPPGPTLAALTVAGHPFGPAGVGLRLGGSDYACPTVYFFIDRTRIGSGPVDRTGRATVRDAAVPGDATVGVHQIKTSCDPSGTPVARSVEFRVMSSAQHRSAFVTSLSEPTQISLTLRSIGLSAAIAAASFVLLAFPSQVFNSTLQENYEEVRGWFHLKRSMAEVVQRFDQRLVFPVFLVAGGVLYAVLAPGFGLNRSTAALALGLAVAVAVTTVGFALPTFAYFRFRFHDRGQIQVLPGTIVVGAAFVAISRIMHFQPGYLYGLMAVFVFHREVDDRTTGRLAATGTLFVLILALVAWFARVPVSGTTMKPGAGFWSLVLESALAGAFVIGLESTLVSLLPMRFLDGSRIRDWNPTAWVLLMGLGLFTLVEVLLRPGSGYVGHSSAPAKIAVLTLYLVCAAGSFAFWAYFRYRSNRPVKGLALEGDYGVR